MPPRSRSSPPPPPPSSRPHPPRHPKGPKHHRHGLALDAQAIDAALAGIVPDERDRTFIVRCILDEGPRHHRIASWALLRLLAAVLAELGGAEPKRTTARRQPVAMRLPPIVAASTEDAEFPIGLPTTLLGEVLTPKEAELALDGLRDGPPHHALANAAMTWMIEAIYERVRGQRSGVRGSDDA